MAKCANCGAALDPGWKFCTTCGSAIPAASGAGTTVSAPQDASAQDTSAQDTGAHDASAHGSSAERPPAPVTPEREPIPSAIRPDEPDDGPLPRPRMDAALIFGIVVAVGGGILIIVVAIALFSPRG